MVDNKFTGAGGMADSQRRRKMKKISWNWAPLLLFVWGTIADLSYSAASKTAMRKRIVNQARRMIGIKQKKIVVRGKSFRFDCSGFIFACYYGVGIDLEKKIDRSSVAGNLSYQLYKGLKGRSWKHRSRMPRPGDLVFFHNTYDRNRNRRWDDKITHVGLVEKVARDGTITWIHLVRSGIRRYVMHLRYPRIFEKKGKRYNDFLRRRPKKDANSGKYLSGSLFATFSSPL